MLRTSQAPVLRPPRTVALVKAVDVVEEGAVLGPEMLHGAAGRQIKGVKERLVRSAAPAVQPAVGSMVMLLARQREGAIS